MATLIDGTLCYNCADIARAQKAQSLGVSPSRIGSDGEIKPDPAKTSQGLPGKNAEPLLQAGNRGTTVNLLS